MIIKIKVKYNDGMWRPQSFPPDFNKDVIEEAIEFYDMLTKFKDLEYIQDFTVKLIIRAKDNTSFEIDVADLIQHTNEQI